MDRITKEMHTEKDYIMRLQIIKINILLKAFLIFSQVQEGVFMNVDLEKMYSI